MNTQAFAYENGKNVGVDGVLTSFVPATGRAMISAIFLLSGAAKITAPAVTIGYIRSAGLPLPEVAFGLSACVELLGGLSLLLGFQTRIVASILFLFSLATAVLFHTNLADQNQFLNFFKNIAMAGGLLHVLAFGGGRFSLDARRA